MVGGERVSSTSTSRSAGRFVPPVAWDLLGWLGFALFVVGGADFLLTWFPERFGNPEWEFGTITASLNAMPACREWPYQALLIAGPSTVLRSSVRSGMKDDRAS